MQFICCLFEFTIASLLKFADEGRLLLRETASKASLPAEGTCRMTNNERTLQRYIDCG